MKFLPAGDVEAVVTTDEQAEFWSIEVGEVSPSALNSKAAALASVGITAPLTYECGGEANCNDHEITIAQSSVLGCSGTDWESYGLDVIPETGASGISLITFSDADTNPILRLKLKPGTISKTELKFTCDIETFSYKNDNLVTNPEIDSINITVKVYNEKAVSDEIFNKIAQTMESSLVKAKWLTNLQQIIEYGATMCNVINIISQVKGLVNGIGLALTASSFPPAVVVGEALIDVVVKPLIEVQSAMDSVGITTACEIITCTYSINAINKYLGDFPIIDIVTEQLQKVAQAQASFGGASADRIQSNPSNVIFPSVENSMILSVPGLCPKGLINGLQKIRAIKCNYANCLYQYGSKGFPIKGCVELKRYQTCKFVYGQIFALIPFTEFINGIAKSLQQVLTDPVAMLFTTLNLVCAYTPTAIGSGICTSLLWIDQASRIGATIRNLPAAFESAGNLGNDVCETANDNYDEVKKMREEEGVQDTSIPDEQNPLGEAPPVTDTTTP